ncbi:MAG TPA: acyl-CoA dehydrogenase family protein [Acidimicrobiales bacterium]|nr:acyl-CoA dehydrogenase family protein [Acidimicrobiales bacterium]
MTAEDLRVELRDWLATYFTDDVRASVETWDGHLAWNAALVDAGWGAVAWPARYGGRDAGLPEQLAYHEEMFRVGAPGPVNAIGVANIAPAIMAVGTDEQRDRFLRPMLRGDEIWSQGMSEPEAGSDLASLRCRAVLDGDHFVVDGQKTWNSNGDKADWCQLYVRTDDRGPKHTGITCLLVDMRTPGIEVRPITTMAGDASFAEVFLAAVRVPVSAVLGEVGEGWAVATRTLSNERAGVAGLYLSLRRKLDRLVAVAAPSDDPCTRQALAARYTEARLLELLARRTLGAMLAGRAPGPEGSVVKLAWAQFEQALANTAVDLLGLPATTGAWGQGLLGSRSLSIAGGTTEVNKNIVGERVLGLPREP